MMQNKITTFVLLLAATLLIQCAPQKDTFISSGLEDVDEIRKQIKMNPTSEETFEERRATLLRWYRLLWRQGIDLDSFDSLANLVVISVESKSSDFQTIDDSYMQLEAILTNPKKINEIASGITESIIDSSPTDWPYFYGTQAERRGFSPDIGPQTGKVAWKYPKGYYWNAPPVLEGDKIYASSPGIDVNAFCIDQKTGQTLWRGKQNGLLFYVEHASRWSPLITQNSVSIRVGYDSSAFRIFDKQTGQRLDQAKPEENGYIPYYRKGTNLILGNASGKDIWSYSQNEFYASEPLLSDNQIVTLTRSGKVSLFDISSNIPLWITDLESASGGSLAANSENIFVGTDDSKIVSLDRKSGSINWTFSAEIKDSRTRQFYSNALLHENLLYIGGVDGVVRCIDQDTGLEQWNVQLTDWIRSRPLILGSKIYVATLDSKLHAIDLKGSHEVQFSTNLGQHGITTDLVGNDNGVIAIGRDLMMYSANPKDGSINWSRGIKDGAWVDGEYYFADWSGGLLGSPTVFDGIAYIGGPDGFVNAVDVETGKEIWRFETNSTTSIAPTVAEDKVFFGYLGATTEHYGFDNPGEYFAVDRMTGELIWSTTAYKRIWVSAVYSEGILFMGNTDGHVYGIDPETGRQIWTYFTGKNTSKEFLPEDTPFTHGFPMGVYCVPTFDENNFYTGSWSGYYFAFDKKTGALKWRCSTKGNDWGGLPDSAAPTLWNGHLYVQKKGGAIAAINIETGEVEWEWWSKRGYLYNGTPGAHNGRVFGSIARKVTLLPYDAKMVAFGDVASGSKQLWEQKDLGGLTAPVLTETDLITGSSVDVFITCLDQATGRIKWRTYTGGEMMENVPAIYGNKVLALSKNGYLFAIE